MFITNACSSVIYEEAITTMHHTSLSSIRCNATTVSRTFGSDVCKNTGSSNCCTVSNCLLFCYDTIMNMENIIFMFLTLLTITLIQLFYRFYCAFVFPTLWGTGARGRPRAARATYGQFRVQTCYKSLLLKLKEDGRR